MPVATPDGAEYIVRVRRSSAVVAPSGNDPISLAADLVAKNARARGRTGWDIVVIRPESAFRAERRMFSQHVDAQAIVVDVAMAVVDALQRGDELWETD